MIAHGPSRKFAYVWLAFSAAVALHVADEAAHNFLSVYNPNVLAIRSRFPFLPIPIFTFREWIPSLGLGILVLLALTPIARRGSRWIRFVAIFLGLIVGIANGLGHIGSSIYMQRLTPGVLSAPVIIVMGTWLISQAVRESTNGHRGSYLAS